jgi:hypothetical protein
MPKVKYTIAELCAKRKAEREEQHRKRVARNVARCNKKCRTRYNARKRKARLLAQGKHGSQRWKKNPGGRPRKPDSEVHPYWIARRKFTEKDISNRTKDVGVMRSPEEIQELLKKLDCDPIARMTKIAERAEKAGDLNIAASLYKELAQYAAPKRKAQEPKVIKDKNLLTMSEDELMAEVTRLEESLA